MLIRFLGKDPESEYGGSPALYATDRTDRRTYIAQGWEVTDPEVLAQLGEIPSGETVIEFPDDILSFVEKGSR